MCMPPQSSNRSPQTQRKPLSQALASSPFVYIPSFYLCTSLLRGEDAAHSVTALQNNWRESVLACLAFWLPAQFVIFSSVPAPARVKCVAAGDCAPLALPPAAATCRAS